MPKFLTCSKTLQSLGLTNDNKGDMTQQKTAYTVSDKFPRLERRLRLGIVGGGGGGFIGSVHALAARMDNRYALVAGALSSNPDRAKAAGADSAGSDLYGLQGNGEGGIDARRRHRCRRDHDAEPHPLRYS